MVQSSDILKGVIVPLITPYHFDEILPLMDFLIESGVSTLFLLGTTGEAQKLQLNQKKELIKKVASHVALRAKLLVGVTGSTIEETSDLMKMTYDGGAFASVVAPRVLGPECDAVIEKLLNSSQGNLLLYNYPKLSGGHFIPLAHIQSFALETRVLGIKDSSRDLIYFNALIKSRREGRFHVYYGAEAGLESALQKQIDGFVPATANCDPKLALELWQKKENGPWEDWNKLKETIREKNPENYVAGVKCLLKERGLITNALLYD